LIQSMGFSAEAALLEAMRRDNAAVHPAAAAALVRLAQTSLPKMVALLEFEPARELAIEALDGLGPEVFPVVVDTVAKHDLVVQRAALPLLRRHRDTIVPWSAELLDAQGSARVSDAAILCLAALGPEVVPKLLPGLLDSDRRPLATRVLVLMGESAIAPLTELARGAEPRVRQVLEEVIGLVSTPH
jgi:hypothetical protein